MSKNISVRRLSPSDVDSYRTIRLAALAEAPEPFGPVYAIEAARSSEAHAARLASSVAFGAFDAKTIIGMVGLKQEEGPKDAHKAFLWGFFVSPTSRRQGVGDALLRTAIEAASGLVEQVTLAVVPESDAITLYKRHGFVTYGVEPRALKTTRGYHDEILMCRIL